MHMGQGRIVIITGCPGTGKTTAASIAAKTSKNRYICIWMIFITILVKARSPHLPEINAPRYCPEMELMYSGKTDNLRYLFC